VTSGVTGQAIRRVNEGLYLEVSTVRGDPFMTHTAEKQGLQGLKRAFQRLLQKV
jgi:hypothetical protein